MYFLIRKKLIRKKCSSVFLFPLGSWVKTSELLFCAFMDQKYINTVLLFHYLPILIIPQKGFVFNWHSTDLPLYMKFLSSFFGVFNQFRYQNVHLIFPRWILFVILSNRHPITIKASMFKILHILCMGQILHYVLFCYTDWVYSASTSISLIYWPINSKIIIAKKAL